MSDYSTYFGLYLSISNCLIQYSVLMHILLGLITVEPWYLILQCTIFINTFNLRNQHIQYKVLLVEGFHILYNILIISSYCYFENSIN